MITHKGLLHLGFSKDDFFLQDDSDGKGVYIKEWKSDKPQPSAEEMKRATDFIKAQEIAQEYAYNRKAEYKALNQFEMQFDDQRDGTTTWVDAINEIKSRYPK